MKLYQAIATRLAARANRIAVANKSEGQAHLNAIVWAESHRKAILDICLVNLPNGPGYDKAVIDLEKSNPERLVFNVIFRHSFEDITRTKLTQHSVYVSADLTGLKVVVGGKDFENVKDEIEEDFLYAGLNEVES